MKNHGPHTLCHSGQSEELLEPINRLVERAQLVFVQAREQRTFTLMAEDSPKAKQTLIGCYYFYEK